MHVFLFSAANMSFNFDYLDSLVSSHPSQYPSSLSLNQSASKSSIGSTWGQHRRPYRGRKMSHTNAPLPTQRSLSPTSRQGEGCFANVTFSRRSIA